MTTRTALVVEDVPSTRRWLVDVVREALPGTSVEGVSSLSQARERLGRLELDLAVVDVRLEDGCGLDLLRDIALLAPRAERVVATTFEDDETLFRALRHGAHGYLLKSESRPQLVTRLGAIRRGEPALSPRIARRIVRHFALQTSPQVPAESSLTPREREVLALIGKGLTRPEVAALLEISPETVKDHVRMVYRKLDICSRSEAALEALRMGLIN